MVSEVSATHWWLPGLRGLLAIAFGLLALFWPLATVLTLAILFGAFMLVDGLTAGYYGITRRHGWWILQGAAGLAAGILALLMPGITAFVLLLMVGAWAVVRGLAEIVTAFRLHGAIGRGWLLGLAGLASVIFGALVVFFPGAGLLAIVWMMGGFAIGLGVLLVAASIELLSGRRGTRPTPVG